MESDVYPTQKRGVPAYQGKNYHELLAYVDSVANVYLDNLWWHIVYGTCILALVHYIISITTNEY